MAVAISCCNAISAAEEWKTYQIEEFDFTAKYPPDWDVQDVSKIPFFLSSKDNLNDKYLENITIIVETMEKQYKLDEYMYEMSKVMQEKISGYSVIDQGRSRIDGKTTQYLVYTTEVGGMYLKLKTYVFLVDDETACVITYSASANGYTRHHKTSELIAKSVKFN